LGVSDQARRAGTIDSMTTVDDLAALSDDARHELVRGRLRLFTYTLMHQYVVGAVTAAVRATYPEDRWLSAHQMSLAVDRETELRPDVIAFGTRHVTANPVPIEGVCLAIDVVAEAWEAEDAADKAEIYRAAGCAYRRVDMLGADIRWDRGGDADPWPISLDLGALTRWRSGLLARART